MKFASTWVKGVEAFLVPLGDIHIGDKGFTEKSRKKLIGYIDWIKAHKNSRTVLMGDLLNCATLNSPTTPFNQNLTLEEQIDEATKLLTPIKGQIIGAIDGNHEQRLSKYVGYSPTISVCDRLKIPYLGMSAVIEYQMGTQRNRHGKEEKEPVNHYFIYAHHTTGGGSTPGGKLNRVDKLRQLCVNADIYLGGHNHSMSAMPFEVPEINKNTKTVNLLRQFIVTTGGFLEWDGSYCEKNELPPVRVGAVKIRLGGSKWCGKDIHVSI